MDYTDEMDAVIHGVARMAHRRYRMVSFDDLYQAGRLWVLEHPRRVEELLERDDKIAWNSFTKVVAKAIGAMARKEKAFLAGYDPEDEAYYPASLVESVLPAVFDAELAEAGPERVDHEIKVKRDPSIGDSWPVHLMDVGRAWASASIGVKDRAMVRARFSTPAMPLDLMARVYEMSEDDVTKALRGAVRAVVDELGGERPRPCPRGCTECLAAV